MANIPEFLKKYSGKLEYTYRCGPVLVFHEEDDCEWTVGHIGNRHEVVDYCIVSDSYAHISRTDISIPKQREYLMECMDVAVRLHEWLKSEAAKENK